SRSFAMPSRTFRLISLIAALIVLGISDGSLRAETLSISLRFRVESVEGSGRYHTLTRTEAWDPGKTAIIVCDMWDTHSSQNAVRREAELAPRLEQVLQAAREQGVTILHAPSNCMEFYEGHPSRERAKAAPKADNLPAEIGEWCYRIPSEERGTYPVDQSDG